MTESINGIVGMSDLFNEVIIEQDFADDVNERTYERLKDFVEIELGGETPERMSVQQIVQTMFKFQSAECKCWQLLEDYALNQSALSDMALTHSNIDRVYARCAVHIARVLEETLQENKSGATGAGAAGGAGGGGGSGAAGDFASSSSSIVWSMPKSSKSAVSSAVAKESKTTWGSVSEGKK